MGGWWLLCLKLIGPLRGVQEGLLPGPGAEILVGGSRAQCVVGDLAHHDVQLLGDAAAAGGCVCGQPWRVPASAFAVVPWWWGPCPLTPARLCPCDCCPGPCCLQWLPALLAAFPSAVPRCPALPGPAPACPGFLCLPPPAAAGGAIAKAPSSPVSNPCCAFPQPALELLVLG